MHDDDRAAVLRIAQSIAALDLAGFEPVLRVMRCTAHAAGSAVVALGEVDPPECFVLEGIVKTGVGDAEGRDVTLAFHVAPGVLMPSVTRVAQGRSRVDCIALTPVRVARFPYAALVACMVANPVVRAWGDAVLQAELRRRADREWSLAAETALQRLQRLRRDYPSLEQLVAHHHIASYLGITPVSFSRLRAQLRGDRAAGAKDAQSGGGSKR